MKAIVRLLSALLVNSMSGALVALALGLNPAAGAAVMNLVALAFAPMMPHGVAMAGVLKEIWTGEMVKALRQGLDGSWLDGVPDNSSLVNNDSIHLVDVGIDPDVLVNNTTYPIALQPLPDGDINISLDKFQTKVTPVTDDELYAASYDKIQRVKEAHAHALLDTTLSKAAHALCAGAHTATTPILATTGATDDATGRKRMTMQDIVAMKKQMDVLKVPTQGRRLVLCTDHVNDLLETEQAFREQYNINRADGTVGRIYGFDVYEYGSCPHYSAQGVKLSLGTTPGTGEFQASFAFYTPRVFKATGSTSMYYSAAETDPEYQRNKINFRHYFVCMFKKHDAGVVMRSTYVAPAPVTPPQQLDQ